MRTLDAHAVQSTRSLPLEATMLRKCGLSKVSIALKKSHPTSFDGFYLSATIGGKKHEAWDDDKDKAAVNVIDFSSKAHLFA
jgi:hypothetical protein